MSETPSIYQLISKVKGSIGSVGKGKQMKEGPAKYAYRSVDDILDAAHAGLVEHGVFWTPSVESADWSDFTTKSGTKGTRVVMTIAYQIYGPAGDSVTAKVIGEAQDYSDKAANKAFTAAEKILLSQLFAIPFAAQDPDDERPERMTTGHGPEPTSNRSAPEQPEDFPVTAAWIKGQILEVVGGDKDRAVKAWESYEHDPGRPIDEAERRLHSVAKAFLARLRAEANEQQVKAHQKSQPNLTSPEEAESRRLRKDLIGRLELLGEPMAQSAWPYLKELVGKDGPWRDLILTAPASLDGALTQLVTDTEAAAEAEF